jgi:glycerol uptake facilitator-like aquaporin
MPFAGAIVAIALLANALATRSGQYALISVFGPVSGAYFNPPLSLVEAFRGRLQQGPVQACGRSMQDHFWRHNRSVQCRP